jgi:hypothetical protein
MNSTIRIQSESMMDLDAEEMELVSGGATYTKVVR